MSVYIIGCLHLGHENMAKMRGWESSIEHDAALVVKWNRVISKRDKVFILGDVTMENSKAYHILDQLNGMKHVILGNHDRGRDIPELLKHVEYVSGPVRYKKDFWLTHIPVHPVEFDYRIRIKMNIHAHIHDVNLEDPRYLNVDAHRVGYTPVSFDVIKKMMLNV